MDQEGRKIGNLTPHWRRIKRDHAEAHAVLQRFAEGIYERAEGRVHPPDDEVDSSTALELGFLERNDDGVAFSDPDVRRDYLVRHVADLALEAWDDLEQFARALEDARDRTLDLGSRREVTAVVLLVLAPLLL
jgi:hypothetical protein